jgi:putative ABC transport system ATP-binding protein
MKELLTAHEVTKMYPINQRPALDSISFSVLQGEFAAIMGASGSGKTTLLNVLSTIDKPTGGNITIGGVNIANLRDKASSDFRKDRLGFIFQEYFLLDSLTVFENIAVPLTLLEIPHGKIEAKVQELAGRFGIASELHKYPNELSGGQRQRAAAARALVKNPSILFADEPTGALDSHSSTELLEMLAEANGGLNTTILMVTHDAYAASFAGRIILLKDGKIQSELYRDKQSDRRHFYESILGAISKSAM